MIKKRQKTGTAKTRAEARQLEAKLIREAGTGQHRVAGNKTVAELLDAWAEWRLRKGEIADHPGHRRVAAERRGHSDHRPVPGPAE